MTKWRFIDTETHPSSLNMALDEACMQAIQNGHASPTIRFYRWQPSAISIGYFQSLEREVDLAKCEELGVDHVRRQTGGGAVYHDYEGEITYSVIAPQELFPKDIIQSYEHICQWLINGFANLGLEATFKPINDIIVNSKKVSGNAQVRKQGVLLQHGTILYKVDVAKMFSLLKVPDEKIRDKMISTVSERVTSINDEKPETNRETAEQAFKESFLAGKEFNAGTWTEQELEHANELSQSKYSTSDWNRMR